MMRVHPLVGAGSLIAGATLIPDLSLARLVIASIALLLACIGTGAGPRCWRGLLRLRWLLAALALVYLADTPGEPILPALPGFSREGLEGGLRRALVLVDIVAGVALLLQHAGARTLAGGLLTALRPLQSLGWDGSRTAIRLALTLEIAEALVGRMRTTAGAGPLQACAGLIRDIESGAAAAAEIEPLAALPAPPAWQWLLPLMLGVALWAAGG